MLIVIIDKADGEVAIFSDMTYALVLDIACISDRCVT